MSTDLNLPYLSSPNNTRKVMNQCPQRSPRRRRRPSKNPRLKKPPQIRSQTSQNRIRKSLYKTGLRINPLDRKSLVRNPQFLAMSSHAIILCLRLRQKLDQIRLFVEFGGFRVACCAGFSEFETEVVEFFETSFDVDEGFLVTFWTFFAPVARTGSGG
jgi:hypothetical protein